MFVAVGSASVFFYTRAVLSFMHVGRTRVFRQRPKGGSVLFVVPVGRARVFLRMPVGRAENKWRPPVVDDVGKTYDVIC